MTSTACAYPRYSNSSLLFSILEVTVCWSSVQLCNSNLCTTYYGLDYVLSNFVMLKIYLLNDCIWRQMYILYIHTHTYICVCERTHMHTGIMNTNMALFQAQNAHQHWLQQGRIIIIISSKWTHKDTIYKKENRDPIARRSLNKNLCSVALMFDFQLPNLNEKQFVLFILSSLWHCSMTDRRICCLLCRSSPVIIIHSPSAPTGLVLSIPS